MELYEPLSLPAHKCNLEERINNVVNRSHKSKKDTIFVRKVNWQLLFSS